MNYLEEIRPEVNSNSSLFSFALQRLAKSMQTSGVFAEWSEHPPSGAIIEVDHPKDFCRLWSSLQFLFCQPTMEQFSGEQYTDKYIFGDGFSWAGCILLYLTGHRERFQYLDFVYYILKTQEIVPENFEVDAKAKKKGKLTAEQQLYPYVEALLASGREIQELNTFIFSMLESYVPAPKKRMFKFHPVVADDKHFTAPGGKVASVPPPPSAYSAPPPPPPPSF